MDNDSWSFYIILIIIIIVAKLLIVISVCCVHHNRRKQRVIVQRRILQGATVPDSAALFGYGQNSISSSEFQPAFQPGPNGILGVHPPPYSEHTPKPPPYSPSNIYTAPTAAQEAMTPAEDPRVDISQTDGLVSRV